MSVPPSRPETQRLPSIEPRSSALALLVAGAAYPLWFLLTPDGARDAWWTWAAVGLVFVAIGATALLRQLPSELLDWMVPGWVSTFQVYLLASLNDMHLFYTVASLMSVLAMCAVIGARVGLLVYGVFIVVLGGVLIALDPDPLKLACWVGVLPMVALAHQRLVLMESREAMEADYRSRLEREVSQRTRQLSRSNEKLWEEMQERERLEERLRTTSKLEAVGRLAGGMSHEFNNLLTRIRLYSELAVEAAGNAEAVRNEIEEVQRAAGRAAELTRQLLTISRHGQAPRERVDLNEVVRTSEGMLQRLLGRPCRLECRLSSEPLVILADVRELEQILVNLALNARDAMPQGGDVVIETSRSPSLAAVTRSALDRAWAVLRFRDTGKGMDPETRERVFDPFFTQKAEGTGLGLSMVHGILAHAGGEIAVASAPGQGATFELCWPRLPGRVSESTPPSSSRSESGGGERVLVVEDQSGVRSALERLMRSRAYRVSPCESGEEALRLAREGAEPFDLLVSDVVLPGMSGIELASTLHEEGLVRRVLLISGHLRSDGVAPDVPEGCAFLPKPFSSQVLMEEIHRILSESRARSPDPAASSVGSSATSP